MANDFKFGAKNIPEMYFGNLDVIKVYFGSELIWEKAGDVSYDDTCTAIIIGDSTNNKFTVQIMKNGADVTNSLKKFRVWANIVDDILPIYRYYLADIPKGSITSCTEIPLSTLVSEAGYTFNTKGEYQIAANKITSKKDDSQFPSSGTITSNPNIYVPYTLTEDSSNHDVWIIVKPSYDITVAKIMAAYSGTIENERIKIFVYHECGLPIYSYFPNYTETISVSTYSKQQGKNYVTKELDSSCGNCTLKAGNRYFIKFKYDLNNNHNLYYRDGGILGIEGYTTDNLSEPNGWRIDLSGLTWKGRVPSESDILKLNVDEYAIPNTGGNIFTAGKPYKCKTKVNFIKETTIASDIYSSSDSTAIYKYTGTSIGNILTSGNFYKCSAKQNNVTEINAEPAYDDVSTDELLFMTNNLYNGNHSYGWSGAGFYIVTSKDSSNNTFNVTQQTNPFVYVETSTLSQSAELIDWNNLDLTNVNIQTDHKYEILLRAE